jgi:iron complex transport system substrate-binding protein
VSRIRSAAVLLAGATLVLAGCATGDTAADTAGAGEASDGFPVTIEHAFGETVIDDRPERVATVAWANHEVPIALGVMPVGMEFQTYGDDDGDGILPWVEDALAELGGEPPVLYDNTDGLDYEAIADTAPDVILASYSGITQEEYDTLSEIAPVVAYPDTAWTTSYEDMIRMNSEAMGMSAEGDALIDDLHAQVDEALAGYPELTDTAPIFAFMDPSDLSKIGFYTLGDPRTGFFDSLGLPVPGIVEEESDGAESFYVEVSSEAADRFADVGLFITYGDEGTDILAMMQADPLLSQIPAIADGHVAVLDNADPLTAAANPSPLSIPWGIDDYFAELAAPLG